MKGRGRREQPRVYGKQGGRPRRRGQRQEVDEPLRDGLGGRLHRILDVGVLRRLEQRVVGRVCQAQRVLLGDLEAEPLGLLLLCPPGL